MKWCHRAVRDKLRELCEPFGLPVLETPAAYSSRFCSRTGVPGFRAREVTVGFENQPPWCWLKDKQSDGKLTEEALLIRHTAELLHDAQNELEAECKRTSPGRQPPRRTLLLPQAGGPIFIPATDFTGTDGLPSAVAHADVNAAINLGLRAVADPRLWDIHPRLRTERVSGEVRKHRDKKSSPGTPDPTGAPHDLTVRLKAREKRKFGEKGPELPLTTLPKGSALEDTRNPNYFCDVAHLAKQLSLATDPSTSEARRALNFARSLAEADKVEMPDPYGSKQVVLLSSKAFWGAVKSLQWHRINSINQTRLAHWRNKLDRMPD